MVCLHWLGGGSDTECIQVGVGIFHPIWEASTIMGSVWEWLPFDQFFKFRAPMLRSHQRELVDHSATEFVVLGALVVE